MKHENLENLIERSRKISELQQLIDSSPDKVNEQIDIFGKPYLPRDGDMVELPDGSLGGITVAVADKDGKYEIILEDGIKVKVPASKLLLRGCWTAYINYKKLEKI
jgi:hypothetical protein